jgi:hypothetical protein
MGRPLPEGWAEGRRCGWCDTSGERGGQPCPVCLGWGWERNA